MASTIIMSGVLVLLVLSAAASSAAGGLQMDFYSSSCPRVEELVKEEMVDILKQAPTLAGPLLRLHFHDCFVRVRTCNIP